ncbi:MAG: adenosine deaminase [Alphaproteobacteria bacterium]|nr:adenosine deaminase [Alphaproteobacteria bacterium]
MTDIAERIRSMPKAELHLHIEGTLEPELTFQLAERNGVPLRWPDVDALRAAYDFQDLQSFLDLYYEGAGVLRTAEDFHDLAWAYFQRAAADRIVHAEIFFDPQTHTDRGIPFDLVMEGLQAARARADRELGLSTLLICCFLRHASEASAFATLEELTPWAEQVVGVGLDSAEVGNPPEKFARVFAAARERGFRAVAHAGEEGPPSYIRGALDALRVERIDHGVRCLEDPELVARLARERVPLTVCPLSNLKLRVVERLEDHNLGELLAAGLVAMVNSDDPAYFGGYLTENLLAVHRALGLDGAAMRQLGVNAFEASWLASDAKARWIAEIDALFA